MNRRLGDVLLVSIGLILSPLTWWNDLVVNVPLAYVFSLPFSLVSEKFFLFGFILGYWLSNLLGFLMLHWGGEGLISKKRKTISIKHSLYISVVYSFLIIALVLLDWISPPTEYLQYIK